MKKLGIVVVGGGIFLLSFFLLSVVLIGVFLIKNQGVSVSNGISESARNVDYQYLQVTERDETVVGSVSIPLMNEDYSFRTDNNGNKMLVSKFGLEEYQCTGSCFCETDRRATVALSRTTFTLLAALSTFVALKNAKTEIQDECVSQFAESCSVESIRSSVEECSPLSTFSNEVASESNTKTYLCYGKCKECTNTFDWSGRRSTGQNNNNDGCSDKTQHAEVVVDADSSDAEENRKKAEEKYKSEVLDKFCETQKVEIPKVKETLSRAEMEEIYRAQDPHWDLRNRKTCCGGKVVDEAVRCRETHGKGSCGKCDGHDHE